MARTEPEPTKDSDLDLYATLDDWTGSALRMAEALFFVAADYERGYREALTSIADCLNYEPYEAPEAAYAAGALYDIVLLYLKSQTGQTGE